ncbi:breast cancer associated RING 1 [Euphorbia peplus]|nr:breast cancer associated RING 1 [Euphorbia peplus]
MPTNSQTNKLLAISNPKPDFLSTETSALLCVSSIVKTSCGFCQSDVISEETGPMLHFVNGKVVYEDEAYLPNAVHVHRICVEWASQVHFIGEETVKNLKEEVVRGAKFNCIECKVKGAILGCYHKSCPRTYHVMCAKKIAGCRWDYENYLLLCPSHTSVKFPDEKKSKSKNQAVHTQTASQHTKVPDEIAPRQSNFWLEPSKRAKERVFCGSALSSEDKKLMIQFGVMIGVTVTRYWMPNVTHVIAATDEEGAFTRTMQVLMAILNGRWVLTIDWVKAGLKTMCLMNEEPYEVSLDNQGCRNGPKTGRLSVLENAPKLLNGFSFYFSGDIVGTFKKELKILVEEAGGVIIDTKEEIVKEAKPLVVYNNRDSPKECKLGEVSSSRCERLKEVEYLETQKGIQVVGATWLLESIAAYKVQPFVTV